MFYKKFKVKCNCEKAKELTWDSVNSFYFCDECNETFDEIDTIQHIDNLNNQVL